MPFLTTPMMVGKRPTVPRIAPPACKDQRQRNQPTEGQGHPKHLILEIPGSANTFRILTNASTLDGAIS